MQRVQSDKLLMQITLEKYGTQRRKATVSAEVSLGRESDVHFRQHYRSSSLNFSSVIKRIFEKCIKYVHGIIFFKFSNLKTLQDLTNFTFCVFNFLYYNVIK